MKSELRRAAIRIASNYARLGVSVCAGLLLVPMLLGGVGEEGFGIYGLLGATVGLADLFREVVRASMVRELGVAYHDPDPARLAGVYNSTIVLAAGLAAVSAALFGAVYLLVPLLNIPAAFQGAAQSVVLAMGLSAAASVLLAPQFNMYVVTERMALYNVWTAGERVSHVAAAVVVFVLMDIADRPAALTTFAYVSASFVVAMLSVAVGLIVWMEPRLRPDLRRFRPAELRNILATSGWNAVTVVAMNMHIRLDQLIMNIPFGAVYGNAVFSLAVTLTGYIRMITTGVTDGLDAVAVRMSRRGGDKSLVSLVEHSTRLHAAVALPAGLTVLVLAEPLLRLWVGRRVQDPTVLENATLVVRVLGLGFVSRAISDGWLRTLYGAGHIRRYAPLVLAGGAANPLVAVLLLWLLPEPIRFLGPAMAFALILTTVHLLTIPFVVRRCVGVSVARTLAPVLRCGAAATLSAPAYPLVRTLAGDRSLSSVALAVAAYGGLYAIASCLLVLRPSERRHLVAYLRAPRGRSVRAPDDAREGRVPDQSGSMGAGAGTTLR